MERSTDRGELTTGNLVARAGLVISFIGVALLIKYEKATFEPISSGQTCPNSTCPVCGDPVFFYMSPFGERVFFDELGSPWPKHPRSDLSVMETSSPRPVGASKDMAWLSSVEIEQVESMQYLIPGAHSNRRFQFYFAAIEFVMAEIVRFRPLGKGRVEPSILDYSDEYRQWFSWDGVGFVHPTETTEQALTKTILHSHDNSAQRLPPSGRTTGKTKANGTLRRLRTSARS